MQNNKIKKFISFYEFIMKEIISKDGLLIFISYIQSNIISHEHCIKMVHTLYKQFQNNQSDITAVMH